MRSLPLFFTALIKFLHVLRPNALVKVSAVSLSKPAPHCRSWSIWRFFGLGEDRVKNLVCLVLVTRCLPVFASALARSRSSCFFKKADHFLLFRQFWLGALRLWLSRGFFSFASHHHGKESSALRDPTFVFVAQVEIGSVFKREQLQSDDA
jgi:hypothetical protein